MKYQLGTMLQKFNSVDELNSFYNYSKTSIEFNSEVLINCDIWRLYNYSKKISKHYDEQISQSYWSRHLMWLDWLINSRSSKLETCLFDNYYYARYLNWTYYLSEKILLTNIIIIIMTKFSLNELWSVKNVWKYLTESDYSYTIIIYLLSINLIT